MVIARDRQKAERAVGGEDETGLPNLRVTDLVRGQDPTSGERSLGGTLEDVVHGNRTMFIKFHKSGNRIFQRRHVKLDTTK